MSLRVMVVEDEPPILRTIEKMIKACDKEFTVSHTAKNGAEALECLRKSPVDVIFTDIRMPLIDGIALMESVNREYPGIFIIVLSGYQEFEYAQHALKNNAFDYLLKPVTSQIMSQTLSNIKYQYQKRNRLKKTAGLMANLHNARNVLAARLSETYLMAVICAGPAPLSDEEDVLLPGHAFWDGLDCSFMDENKDWLLLGRSQAERIFIHELDLAENIEQSVSAMISSLKNFSHVPLTVLYYNHPLGVAEIGTTLRELQRYLPSVQRMGESVLFPLSSLHNPPKAALSAEETSMAKALADALKYKGADVITECLDASMEMFKRERALYSVLYQFFEYVLSLYGKDKPLPPDTRDMVYESLYHALSYEDLRLNILNLFESLRAENENDLPKTPDLIDKVTEYLEEFYSKPITSVHLSRKFGFVPSYISRVFRQNTGVSPADYLTTIRLNEAKRLLRERPELMVKEIAFLVGFKDQFHFSKTFKKKEGLWPTDYRK